MTRWRPNGDIGGYASTAGQLPEVGQVIAWVARREAWRVIQVDEVAPANWSDQTTHAWHEAAETDWQTWPGRERMIGVEPPRNPAPNRKDRRGLRLSPWWNGEQWRPLHDPYPVCIDCGLLYPCPCYDRNEEAAAAMTELDRLAGIMPGCCWACGEPIIGRQRSITFDGENLLLPGGGPVAFHTAYSRKPVEKFGHHLGTCRDQAEAYEDTWVFAGVPGRRVRLRCAGIQFRHYSASMECTVGASCPGSDARHQDWHHCTTRVGPGNHSATFVPGAPAVPDEIQPPTNCGGPHCRGIATSQEATRTGTKP